MTKIKAIELADQAYDDIENGKLLEAKKKLERALALSNEVAPAHNEYALVLTMLKADSLKIKKHISKAIELGPRNPKYWASLARWYFENGNYERALTLISFVEELDPSYPAAKVARIQIEQKLGNYQQAVKARKAAKKLYEEQWLRSDLTDLSKEDLKTYLTIEKSTRKFLWRKYLIVLIFIIIITIIYFWMKI